MKRIVIVGYLITYLSTALMHAQSKHVVQGQYKFKYLTVDQGLSNNWIRSICQDSKGFIWIATENGINKFDGQSIVTYRNDPKDSTTISSNNISTIFLDSESNFWIGTNVGLDLYNSDFDNFIRFSHKDIDWQIGKVEMLVEDKNGKLWIGAATGLYAYDLTTSEIQYFSNKEDNPHGIPPNSINRLLVDRNNNLWFSILNQGLCIYNQNEGTFRYFKNNPEDPTTISGNHIHGLYEDRSGRIWVGTLNNGLNCYIPESNSFVRTIPDPKNNYSKRISLIFEDLNENFFIGTRAGLYIRNDRANKFVRFAHERHIFSKLKQNSITSRYIDKTGILWIGTHAGGVNYTNLNKKKFIHYSADYEDNHFLSGANIYAITEDPNGNLWVGGDNGLNYLDRTTHTFKYYTYNPDDPYSLSYNDVKALDWDKKGNLWIGTNKGGLNYYNTKTGKFKSYRHDPDDPNSLSRDKIYGLMCDKSNNLWILTNPDILTQYSNIDILPDGSDKFIHLNEKAYYGFDQDENGNIFIGGVNGFWIFSRKDSIYSFISNDTLIGQVTTVRRDSKNSLWIGSEKGLVRYNIEDKSFIWFSENNGYPISEVFGILEDDSKNLWVSTNFGLVKITNIIEDINNITFRVFDSDDGLQSKQFNYNAYYKSKSGEMIFGGINGFNTFYPNEIVSNTVPPNIVLTDLKIFNRTVQIGEKVSDRVILKKSIEVTDEITLGPKQNIFTLEFAALHYANPEKNTFKFKLEGVDKDWQYRKASNNFVTYTYLPPGEYTFIITASNSDGVWNEDGKSITIRILPPWWDNLWFKGIVLLGIIGFIFTVYRTRVNALKRQHGILEQKVEERTIELKRQKEEILTQNEEIQQQSEELETQRDEIQQKNETLEKTYQKIKILNSFGQELTTVLNLAAINDMIYNYISSLLDVSIFGIGIYNEETNSIDFTSLMEDGKPIPEFVSPLDDPTSCAAWCYKNQKHIFSNRFKVEYKNFISELKIRSSKIPESLIYLPLTVKGKQIGILTLQSYNQNAYTENDLQTLQTLASYIAIALDNANAYDIVKQQNIELGQHRSKLEKLVQERTKDLEEAKIRAEESDKLKTAFLANMSHEIRTPLNAIVGFADLIVDENPTKITKNEMIQIIEQNSSTLLNLINDIIDFSKIEAGEITITESEFDVSVLLKEVYQTFLKDIRRKEKEKEVKFLLKLNEDEISPIIKTDAIRLRQILSNLIDNAIKYTEKGYIEFAYLSSIDDYITFYVEDTGMGIEKKNFDKVFERFSKIEQNGTYSSGTGLGLSIAKYLVERLGGEIWFESEPGEGSKFMFKLPVTPSLKTSDKTKAKTRNDKIQLPNWQNKKVLIVEDESSNYMLLETLLKNTKISVIWAKDGEEAVELFKEHNKTLDIILLDIKLPKKDGITVAKEMRSINHTIPIIAQTAYALPEEEYRIRAEYFDDYLAKPISKSKLFDVMSSFI